MTMVLAATALLVAFMLGVNVGGELMSAAWDRANSGQGGDVKCDRCEGEGTWHCNGCGGDYCDNCIAFMYHDCPSPTEAAVEAGAP